MEINKISGLNSTTRFNDSFAMEESFKDVFQRALKNENPSLKTEAVGILTPVSGLAKRGQHYKLITDSDEIFLKIGDSILPLVKKLEWEEVKVKGSFSSDLKTFTVDRVVAFSVEDPKSSPSFQNWGISDVWEYKRMISQYGKVEPALEYMAS